MDISTGVRLNGGITVFTVEHPMIWHVIWSHRYQSSHHKPCTMQLGFWNIFIHLMRGGDAIHLESWLRDQHHVNPSGWYLHGSTRPVPPCHIVSSNQAHKALISCHLCLASILECWIGCRYRILQGIHHRTRWETLSRSLQVQIWPGIPQSKRKCDGRACSVRATGCLFPRIRAHGVGCTAVGELQRHLIHACQSIELSLGWNVDGCGSTTSESCLACTRQSLPDFIHSEINNEDVKSLASMPCVQVQGRVTP